MSRFLDENGLAYLWAKIQQADTDTVSESVFYDEITTEVGRVFDTDYYVTTVPKYDASGNLINLFVAHDTERDPLEYAAYAHTTLTINGNCTILRKDQKFRAGITIGNGEVLNSNTFYGQEDNIQNPIIYEKYIGFTRDRDIIEYDMTRGFDGSLTPQVMLDDGCLNVVNCYFKLISDSAVVDFDNAYPPIMWNRGKATKSTTRPGPMMLMGIKADGDLVFFTSDGRTDINKGLTFPAAAQLLLDRGCINAYTLDGGGSASMVIRGSKINRNIDAEGTRVRRIKYSINFAKSSDNTATQEAYAQIGLEKQRIIKQIIPYINRVNSLLLYKQGTPLEAGNDLNNCVQNAKYYSPSVDISSTLLNCPVLNSTFTMLVIQIGQNSNKYLQLLVNEDPIYLHYRIVSPSKGYYQAWAYIPGIPLNKALVIAPQAFTTVPSHPNSWQASVTWSIGRDRAGIDQVIINDDDIITVRITEKGSSDIGDINYSLSGRGLMLLNTSNSEPLHAIVAAAV